MMDSGGVHAAASSLRQTPTEPKIAPAVRRRNGGSDFWPDFSKSVQTDQEPDLLPRNKLSSVASDSATELICQQQATRYSAVSASSPVTRSGSDEKFRLVFFTQRWRGGAQARARNPKLPKSNHARRNFAAI
eukprot:TRINITY_DN28365_c0_g1_i2.p1 TRINITY_DN28365_c0_g1~~TRINITY_DN28365_c0_g1_i2.p1  ORF type:complete len:132 (-),score=13.64 TRINITY_DN28365_c0_g1_i2:9-404(-)